MKMNLTQILALVDMNKPLYDARRREKQLGFMQDFEAYISDHEGVHNHEVKRNRYRIEHAVALATFQSLVARGLPTAEADYIVGNQFSALIVADRDNLVDFDPTEIGSADPYHIGAIYFSDARKLHLGGPASRCIAMFKDHLLEGQCAILDGKKNDIKFCTPTELILVNVTETYRNLRARLLDGLGL